MPDVDAKLATGLRQAKTTPMFFAFVAKGASDGALLVARKKISTKEINEAKESCGGKLVFRGRCVGEEGKLVFEVPKEPPGTLAKQLKTIIQRDAGMNMQVETRMVAGLEEGAEGEGAAPQAADAPPPPPAPPPIASDAAARFAARLKALAPVMQTADATGSPLAKDARLQVVEANKLFVAKQEGPAHAALDKAEALIKQALSAPPPPPAPPATDGAARFSARLKALAPTLQQAEATGSPLAKDARLQINEANKLFVAKQLGPANAALNKAETLIKQALAAPPSATKKPTTAPPPEPDEATLWQERLEGFLENRASLGNLDPAALAEVDKLVESARGIAASGNFEKAHASLDKAELKLDNAARAARKKQAETVIPKGKVAIEKAHLRWRAAKQSSVESLDELSAELQARGDEDSVKAAAILQQVARGFPALLDESLGQLDKAVKSGDAAGVTQCVSVVSGQLDDFNQFLEDNRFYLQRCEDNPFGVEFAVINPMMDSIDEIDGILASL